MAKVKAEAKTMENKPLVKTNRNRRVSKSTVRNITAELTCTQLKAEVCLLKLDLEEFAEKLETMKASRAVLATPESIAECDKFMAIYADKLIDCTKRFDVIDIYLKQRHLQGGKVNHDVGLCTCQPEVSTKAPNLPVAIPEPPEVSIETARTVAALANSLAV